MALNFARLAFANAIGNGGEAIKLNIVAKMLVSESCEWIQEMEWASEMKKM
jgi:hypothetical protein